jgi:hypothetical protein
MRRVAALAVALVASATTVAAQDNSDGFSDTKDGGKLHTGSGFVCPARIDLFERDAVGEGESISGANFCAYSALDGTYGTITIKSLKGPYDPKVSLASDFTEQEGIGAHRIAEVMTKSSGLSVYTRTYETAKLESLHYRMLFSGTAIGSWAVETTIEYADPRDNRAEKEFLDTVYAAALKHIAKAPASAPPAATPPAPPATPTP